MAATKCAVCSKTAYPLESVKALDKTYHKICFKCAVCAITLNVKSFKGVDGQVYCATHTPVDRSSTADGDYTIKSAAEAQKKNSEARSAQLAAQKGTGEAPTQVEDFTLKSQSEAQKKNSESRSAQLAAQKGTGEAPTQVEDFTLKSQSEAQKKNSEARSAQLATQKGTGEAPTAVMY